MTTTMKLKNVGVVIAPSATDEETAGAYKINPSPKFLILFLFIKTDRLLISL